MIRVRGQPLDRLSIERLGSRTVTEQRTCPRLDPERPVRAGDAGSLVQPPEGVGGELRPAAASGCLDQLDERPGVEAQIVMLARPPGSGKGVLVAAEAVEEDRRCVLGQAERPSLAGGARALDGRRRISSRAEAGCPRQATSTSDVYERGALPVAWVSASASSISAAAAANSPACTCTPAR